jgi:uncharacterized protein
MNNETSISKVIAAVCTQALQDSTAYTSHVHAAIIATGDGFEVASIIFRDIHAPKLAAMTSTIKALGEALANEASLPGARNIVIESDGGFVVVQSIDSAHQLVLCMIAGKQSSLGHLVWAARKCSEQLGERLSGRSPKTAKH